MQKLAMMMAVMILGMSPAHGYSIGADSRSLEIGDQVKMMPLLPMWYSDDGTLIARNTVSSVAAEGNLPVEPGGHSVGRTLQQVQLRSEDLERIRDRSGRTTSALREGEAILEDGLRVWHPGDDDPNSAGAGGANLPLDGGGTSTTSDERN